MAFGNEEEADMYCIIRLKNKPLNLLMFGHGICDYKELYSKMAKKTKNGLLKDKLEFLANEEEKHRAFIEEIYMNHFPENKIILPKKTPVPLPEVEFSEDTSLSKLLNQAMNADCSAFIA